MSAIQTQLRPIDAAGRLYDPGVIFIAGALMTIGVAMVYSATVTVQGAEFDWRRWWNSPLKQGLFALAGFVVMLVAAHVDYRMLAWERRGDWWRGGLVALVAIVLLGAVLFVGSSALGARRAIEIPGLGFGFQPSEFAKVALVIWMAALLTRPHDVRDFRTGFLPAVFTGGALIGLTGIEDFGTAALMGAIMFFLLLVGGARWTHLALTMLAGAGAGVLLVVTKPHRMARLATFFNEAPDPSGAGYQINQAMLAIGSGGWWGRGLGAGVRKYGYLPQDNNDFILAIICEELGIVGGIVVVVLFLALLWRGWRIAANAPDRFGRMLAVGLTLMLCLQAAFNVGVVTNSVPTKGISLPFVSAGGSGVLFLGLAAGLLAAVGRTTVASRDRSSP